MKKHIKWVKRSFVGVWVYSGARKRSKWRNAVSCASEPKHLWKKPGCCGECQNGSRLPRKAFWTFLACFLDFWALFASNRPEMHFQRNFKLKIAKWPLRNKFELHFRAQIHFEPQNDSRPQTKIFLDIFARVLFISGLYFTQIRSEMPLKNQF